MGVAGYEKDYRQIIIRDSPLMNHNDFTLRIPEKISYRKVKARSSNGYVESNISSPQWTCQ